uniref:Uncharacterized protein n=1 Tax=Plectus sambesii TaxID=2011161 RepID=A0A914WA57_9BILA
MARHVADCLEQFNTGVDKVLQARQMLMSDSRLSTSDKEKLLIALENSIHQARKRLEASPVDERAEPEGGRADSPHSVHSARPPPPLDANFLAQHGHQLIALLQQNMAKQN